jgi:ATP-binding cassette subfamily G (WHITE) protein 2 (SNQ2)
MAAVLYKQGSGSSGPSSPSDEEALKLQEKDAIRQIDSVVESKAQAAIHPPVTDIFSWQHIDYTVPIPGHEERKLLSDISGYVAPGKLTALMGESGAGKTTLLNVLAQRVSVGVVGGKKFVNGQAIPRDFQSQTYVLHSSGNLF